MDVQAVAEGDAMKADKKRKKNKREEEVDAIFGASDSDDGGDYNPDAAEEEAEYIEPGGDDADLDNDEANLNPLAGTGGPPLRNCMRWPGCVPLAASHCKDRFNLSHSLVLQLSLGRWSFRSK